MSLKMLSWNLTDCTSYIQKGAALPNTIAQIIVQVQFKQASQIDCGFLPSARLLKILLFIWLTMYFLQKQKEMYILIGLPKIKSF